MKKYLPFSFRGLLLSGILLLMSINTFASHIVAAELRYKWVTGLTYQVTVYLYGDCGPSSTSAFGTLPFSTPRVCIYNGSTNVGFVDCPIQAPTAGVEVTPVCPDSLGFTQCTNIFYSLPGIKKFVYTGTYTFPSYSDKWVLVYQGYNGGGSGAGRAAAITNLFSPGSSIMQLIDTLNIGPLNTRFNNSSPVLTVEPIPYFCYPGYDCYNPGAVDLYDVSPSEPAGDSLVFSLVPATGSTTGAYGPTCLPPYGPLSYVSTYCPGNPASGSYPLSCLDCTPASFNFDPLTGQLCFQPILGPQRSTVVYNVQEYRDDTDTTYTINTIAGSGITGGYGGDGGLATLASLNDPSGVVKDAAGNVYFADMVNNRIRKIGTTGVVTTIAGTGIAGYSGDGGPAVTAKINGPSGMAIDAAGNLYFADVYNHAIRKINVAGNISTLAGTGTAGFFGDGGPAIIAQLDSPRAVYVSAASTIYIADAGNERIRTINLAGNIGTLAGNGTAGFFGDGGVSTLPTVMVNHPSGMFVDATGIFYFADAGNNRIRQISGGGILSTVAGNGIPGFGGDGGFATAAMLNGPTALSIDALGYMYIADRLNFVFRKVSPTGRITTIAGLGFPGGFSGDGGPALTANMRNCTYMFMDGGSNIYFSDSNNYRVRILTPTVNVNKIKVGTLQREMTFLVKSCTLTTPVGKIDSFSAPGGGDTTNSHHFISCANTGIFSVFLNPKEADTSLHITASATGLSVGFTFSVVGNNTSSPHVTLTGNTSLIAPGNYIIYVTFTDNHCPLVGTKTYAFTFDILPVPTLTDLIVSPATCTDSAKVKFIPGGTGKPWTIKLSHSPAWGPLVDTFAIIASDTASFIDSLRPNTYYATIFTNVSNNCHVTDTVVVDTPRYDVTLTKTDPTYCGSNDGTLIIHGLHPSKLDSALYKWQGILQPRQGFLSTVLGTDTLTGLLAGTYDSIVVLEQFCATNKVGPITLVNPPFVWRTVHTMETTKCGFCNGIDTLFGLHPGQLDTIKYNFRHLAGGPITTNTVSHFITTDSMAVLSGMCAGLYSNFIINTAGVCNFTIPGPFVVDTQKIFPDFDSVIHYGCHGDTLFFNNLSSWTSPLDSHLSYRWNFGDGVTDTARNPRHLYVNTNGNSYTIKLYITNSICIDSSISSVTLTNYVHSDFTFTPDPFVCQDSLVAFTSTATGTNLTYYWDFGDGNNDITANPIHTYLNTGNYKVKLIASDHVIPTPAAFFTPCFDTATKTISVDSISQVSIIATDSVICRGQAITFKGVYSTLGDTMTVWKFGDGNGIVDVDPILHSFDGSDTFRVTLNVKYRACPENSSSRMIRVFDIPSVYLGPDTAICPGGIPLTIHDDRNSQNPKARWKWNTGETTPGITVVKPGDYYAIVTIDGCSATDTITVNKDCYMDIPNVFTPNNDGTNDYFFPRQFLTRGVISFKMDIYNRWGQLVYTTNAPDGRGWDGKFNDKDQPEGVYVYIIDAKFKDGQIEHHQGNVTLLR